MLEQVQKQRRKTDIDPETTGVIGEKSIRNIVLKVPCSPI